MRPDDSDEPETGEKRQEREDVKSGVGAKEQGRDQTDQDKGQEWLAHRFVPLSG